MIATKIFKFPNPPGFKGWTVLDLLKECFWILFFYRGYLWRYFRGFFLSYLKPEELNTQIPLAFLGGRSRHTKLFLGILSSVFINSTGSSKIFGVFIKQYKYLWCSGDCDTVLSCIFLPPPWPHCAVLTCPEQVWPCPDSSCVHGYRGVHCSWRIHCCHITYKVIICLRKVSKPNPTNGFGSALARQPRQSLITCSNY